MILSKETQRKMQVEVDALCEKYGLNALYMLKRDPQPDGNILVESILVSDYEWTDALLDYLHDISGKLQSARGDDYIPAGSKGTYHDDQTTSRD